MKPNSLAIINSGLAADLAAFSAFGRSTRVELPYYRYYQDDVDPIVIPAFVNKFWAANKRNANSLHKLSHIDSFEPQLTRFLIERLTRPGQSVYQPFMKGGTVVIEAALTKRLPWGSDRNPLSNLMVLPRLNPPTVEQVCQRLNQIDFIGCHELPEDLRVFFHETTLKQVAGLRKYLLDRKAVGSMDQVDQWLSMVVLHQLAGHSPKFCSINLKNEPGIPRNSQRPTGAYDQSPLPMDVPAVLLKKTKALLKYCASKELHLLREFGAQAQLFTSSATETPEIRDGSISLIITSLGADSPTESLFGNSAQTWFEALEPSIQQQRQTQPKLSDTLRELHRVLQPNGYLAIVAAKNPPNRWGHILINCAVPLGFEPLLQLIHDQKFMRHSALVDLTLRGSRVFLLRKRLA